MPILVSSTYVHGYGKSITTIETNINLSSTEGLQDVFVVKYNTLGKALWSARIASYLVDAAYGIATDSVGNVYVTGQGGPGQGGANLGGAVTAYNSDGTAFGTILPNAGNNDVFIMKYDTTGFVQWVARIGSNSYDIGYAIATDSGGNVYVTGQCSSNLIVTTAYNSDGSAFATTLPNSGGGDAFIVKYNTTGSVQWVTRIASTAADIGYGIATDTGGNVYVTGQYTGTLSVFNSTGTSRSLSGSGFSDSFIVKYNTNGLVQWVTRIASTQGDIGYAITTDSGDNVYVTGMSGFATIVAYNSDESSFPTTFSSNGNDAFIVKYNTGGFVQWLTRIGSSGTEVGYDIATDSGGNVYITGQGGGSGDVVTAYNSNGTAFATTLPSSASTDAFVVKYNTSGSVQWVARIASTVVDIGYGITTDSAGNVYVTGQGGVDVVVIAYNSDGTAFATTIPNGGNIDCFIVKYNTNGFVQWVTRLASNNQDIGRGITVDSNSNVYVTGQFIGTQFSIYGQALSLFATTLNAGSTDAFIVKYNTTGSPQWVARIASTAADIGYGIATDSGGNVYVTGQGGTGAVVTAYNSTGTAFATTIANAGGTDVFVVKYNTSGLVQWVTRIASTGDDIGYGIATDSGGNVYVTGQGGSGAIVTAYNSTGTEFATTLSNAGNNDCFIVKYDTGGLVQWVTRIASTAADIGYGIATDSGGNVYVTGQGGTGAVVTAYNSTGTAFATTIPNAGSTDVFVVKYNTSGLVQWVTRVASTAADIGFSVATDSGGNVYVTGQGGVATDVIVYNSNGTAFATTLPHSGGGDAFLVKYNTTGFVQWVARIASVYSDIGYGIATDSTGNVYIVGQVTADVLTAYNSNGTAFAPMATLASLTNTDVFIVKYNTAGFVQWMTRIGSTQGDTGYGIATDSSGNVYVTTSHGTPISTTIFSSNTEVFANVFCSSAVVKYDKNGFVKWAQAIRGTTSSMNTRSLSTDTFGNVIVTGTGPSNEILQVYNVDSTPYKVINSIGSFAVFLVKYSSTTTPLWVAKIDSFFSELGHAIVTDSGGNVYVTGLGSDRGVLTAYNSNGTAFATTIPNAGSNDCFIVKYDTNGFVQWVARIASSAQDYGRGIATDSTGNVYVTGAGGVGVVVTAYNSNGTAFATTLPNAGNNDCFIVKYDTSGFVQWVARIASTGQDVGYAIATDSGGNVYMTGSGGSGAVVTAYNSTGTAFATTLANAGSNDCFIVKYDTSGFVQWVTRVASTAADMGFGIATDSGGNVYVTGQGGSGAVVTAYNSNGTAFATTLANAGGTDAFIVKYDTSGFVQWVARIASTGGDIGVGMATDSGGNVYVTGLGGNTVVVTAYNSNGTAFATTIPNAGGTDVFLVKYNTTGFVQWVARIASANDDIGFSVATDSGGNVYVTGQGGNTVVVTAYNSNGTIFGSAPVPVSGLGNTVFVVKYNTSGSVQWISMMNGSGADQGSGIALDTSNNLYATGQFGGSALVPYSV